ncbi:MAG: hypothetical protein JOZ69_25585, partial [Myxococcales bacterium]|nr:hypothetical protein [Myxococcales bacterium]
MRAHHLSALLVLGTGLGLAAPARAQLPPPSAGAGGSAEPSGLPPPAPATGGASPAPPTPAPGGAGGGTIPSPSANGLPLPEAQALTGAPNPSALTSSATDEWRFTWHGFTRTPMRIGFGKRPQCPTGTPAGTALQPDGRPAPAAGDPSYFFTPQVPCAGPGQSTSNFHSPFVPDSQYLDWRYDRQQEYDWTEIFMNYGNSKVTGTVGIMGFGFSDAEYFNQTNAATQFGIAQAYFTVHPDLGLSNLRLTWKVGAFQDRYGMAAMYDAGPYDTYMFGRTHQMGESLALEVDLDEWTLRLS